MSKCYKVDGNSKTLITVDEYKSIVSGNYTLYDKEKNCVYIYSEGNHKVVAMRECDNDDFGKYIKLVPSES